MLPVSGTQAPSILSLTTSIPYFRLVPNVSVPAPAITSAFRLAGRRKREGKGHVSPWKALLPTSYCPDLCQLDTLCCRG